MKAATAGGIKRLITVSDEDGDHVVDIYTPEGFEVLADLFTRSGWQNKLSYEVTWLGIPIIQLPEDIVIVQELIWRVRPEVIVECGVAHGGALVLYASVLELLGRGRVIGVDVEIRKYNRLAIESHPLAKRITLIEGSSTDASIVASVRDQIEPGQSTMVMLDSNHTRDPGDAGEFVGERDRQHVAVQPLRCLLDPGPQTSHCCARPPYKNDVCGLHEQCSHVFVATFGDLAQDRAVPRRTPASAPAPARR